MSSSSECTVCSGTATSWATAPVMGGRHHAAYDRCRDCGLIRATNVDWLEDAYSSAIADADIGLLDRCLVLGHVTSAILTAMGASGGRYLDWAGGYGVFTRMMRDRGYDFCDYDPYATNIFAAAHRLDVLPSDSTFDAVTAFEVLEHLVDPATEMQPVAALSDVLIATTRILPDPAPRPGGWDYYALESGQHITFYTRRAVGVLGRRLGYDHVVSGSLIHLFSRRPINRVAATLVRRHPVAYLAGVAASVPQRRRSLLVADATTRVC